jgi:DNA helicase-4
MTAHGSKGLQADYVFLLNNKAYGMGFPSQITDAPILKLLLDNCDDYLFAEERRLFYVALTRTRNSVYVLVPEKRCSPFVRELSDLGVRDSHFMGGARLTSDVSCPKCKKGQLILRNSVFGEFMSCSNYPQCDYKISGRYTKESRRCKICGNFMVERRIKNFTRKGWYAMKKNGGDGSFWGCANYPHCTYKESI